MTSSIRIGIVAITSIFLIASMVAYLAPPGSTGLFLEEHGDCTTITGGVHSYRYCGFDVNPVHKEVGFKLGRTDVGFVASDKQQHRPFTSTDPEGLHRLKASWPKRQTGPVASARLNEEPFPQAGFASRHQLFDDPYESSPWDQKR